MGRPKKDDKKIGIFVKLPPSIVDWMDNQPESRAVLIERAINNCFINSTTVSGYSSTARDFETVRIHHDGALPV